MEWLIILKQNKIILILVIIGILFLAGFLRFYHLSLMEFKHDEADNAYRALEFVSGGVLPQTGMMSSIGVYNPPFFIYLLSIPFMLSRDPVIAAGFIALLNVIGVGLCFMFCNSFFSRRVAVMASLLFAVNPWAVMFSRKIWNQNVLTPFVMLFLFSIYKLVFEKNKKFIYLIIISLAVLTQLHMSCVVFLILLGIVLIITRPQIKLHHYLTGLGILIVFYLPYIIFEFQNSFFNIKAFFSFFKNPSFFNPEAFIYPARLITVSGFDYFFGADYQNFMKSVFRYPPLEWGMAVLLIVSIVSILQQMVKENKKPIEYEEDREGKSGKKSEISKSGRRSKKTMELLLLIFFSLPVFSLCFNKVIPMAHYFILLYPVQYIIIALFIDKSLIKLSPQYPGLSLVTAGLIGIVVIYQFIFSINTLNYISACTYVNGDYGTPFRYKVEAIKKEIDSGNSDINQIHTKIKQGPKDDILATKYIVENIQDIK